MVIQCRGKSTELLGSWFLLQSWVDLLPSPQEHQHKIILLSWGLQSSTHQQIELMRFMLRSYWLFEAYMLCLDPKGSVLVSFPFSVIPQQRWGTGERVFLVHSFRLLPIVVMKPATIWTSYFCCFHSQEQGAMNKWMLSPTCFLCS